MPSALKQVELTAEQAAQWDTTQAVAAHTMPGFRYLLISLLNAQQHGAKHLALFTEDEQIDLAATDGFVVILRPSRYFKLKLQERLFVLAHEVAHVALDDVNSSHAWSKKGEISYPNGKSLKYNSTLSNVAQDYRINDFLIQSHIGRMPTGEFQGLHDKKIATANDSWLDVYARIYKEPKDGKDGQTGQGEPGASPSSLEARTGGFDKVLCPGSAVGKDPSTAPVERDPGKWQSAVAQAMELERQKRQGKLSGEMARFFGDILTPKVSWQDLIRGELAMRVGPGSYDWFRPDPRLMERDLFYPSSSGFGTEWVAVWADTSGSIGKEEMALYLAELGGILDDVKPRRLTVLWCDANIKQVDDHISVTDLDRIKADGVRGGGGTDCRPVFQWIEDNGTQAPDMFIGLTDLQARFPAQAPSYPVTWAATHDGKAPFGEIVRIK